MKKVRAFTLIEALLAIVIIAILAAAVIPRISRAGLYSKYLVYTAAHKVAADLRLARRRAVTTGIDHRLECDGNEYGIYERNNGGWVLWGEKKSIPDEITVKGDGNVTFEPSGAANGNKTFKYEIEDYKYSAAVKKETGRVKLEAY